MAEDPGSWLRTAEEDLNWSRASLKGQMWRGACFAAQQSAEKALKAFLISRGKSPPRVHDLAALRLECQKLDSGFQALMEACNILSPYYLSSRYPDVAQLDSFSKDLAENAVEQAEKVLKSVASRI